MADEPKYTYDFSSYFADEKIRTKLDSDTELVFTPRSWCRLALSLLRWPDDVVDAMSDDELWAAAGVKPPKSRE